MSLDLRDCTFVGPAMPEPFVKFQLEDQLAKKKLLPKASGPEAKALQERWDVFRRKLRNLGETGGEVRVRAHVLEPLVELLGWSHYDRAENVVTREGPEDGGHLLRVPPASGEGLAPHLRAWVVPIDTDLDAPNKRGRAYRYSPSLVAQRVLLTRGERVALMTDGLELRILLSDPSGRDSHISIRLDRSGGWRGSRDVPDSFRLAKALCQPAGVSIVGDLLNEARLAQSSVTKKLREQARRAVEQFLQGVLDDPANAEARKEWNDLNATSKLLWREGLVLVYRLLFILKLESSPDPARAFSFASTSLWRNSYSPSTALAPVVADVRDKGAETGEFLASSLRALFRLFSHGMQSSELNVSALGGVLFGKEAMPVLDSLHWSEQAVALLLDALLWTPPDRRRGQEAGGRERVHYGALDVEDLGRVYEALLELEPGIASEPMCRLRRAKLEVVVPIAQGAPYRKNAASDEEESDDDENDEEEESAGKGKTKVAFIEDISAGRFYLRVGLGRKATGSYYTPHAFVRFLVQETLGPQVKERSPQEDPNPLKILELNVLDPAMGSGHFLVEACRFLGNALYEACRLCDERALRERELAESSKSESEKQKHHARALELWQRVVDLPDPNDELVAYLPSRILDADEGGLSQRKALALCRRLVAVHCLYGVDKNPLAVELAKVSLWLESYAEGLPLTFLDHRLVCGDSLTGPTIGHLVTFPSDGKPIETATDGGLKQRLHVALGQALRHVRDLETSVGKDIVDLEMKAAAKARLDEELAPFRLLAAAWTGGVMLGAECDDEGYLALARAVAAGGGESRAPSRASLRRMVELGRTGIPYDLVFPEIFHPTGDSDRAGGFDVVIGNPPWEGIQPDRRQFGAEFNPAFLQAPTRDVELLHKELCRTQALAQEGWEQSSNQIAAEKRLLLRLVRHIARNDASLGSGAVVDYWLGFSSRMLDVAGPTSCTGQVLPDGFRHNLSASILRRELVDGFLLAKLIEFSNRRCLFEIAPGMRFELLVTATRSKQVRAAFGLEEADALFQELAMQRLERPAAPHYVLAESAAVGSTVAVETFGAWAARTGSRIGEELHASKCSRFFLAGDSGGAAESVWPLHEKGTIQAFTDRNVARTRYAVRPIELMGARKNLEPARYFRLAHRSAIHAQEHFKSVFALLPPGVQVAHSAVVEKAPWSYPLSEALFALAATNSIYVNSVALSRVGLNLSKHIRDSLPLPCLPELAKRAVVHAALRLSCNHQLYSHLWLDQLGTEWREEGRERSWPVLMGDESRWAVRVWVDAVFCEAFGLDRPQYQRVLSSLNLRGSVAIVDLCLAAFDELKQIGLDAFCKKHDPYWDIPLVTTLPKPVIDLPLGKAQQDDTAGFQLTAPAETPKRGRGRKGAG